MVSRSVEKVCSAFEFSFLNFDASESNVILSVVTKCDFFLTSGEFNGATQQSEHTLADFFTMRCDMCHETTFSSFASAKEHYLKSHGIVGYLVVKLDYFVKTIVTHF